MTYIYNHIFTHPPPIALLRIAEQAFPNFGAKLSRLLTSDLATQSAGQSDLKMRNLVIIPIGLLAAVAFTVPIKERRSMYHTCGFYMISCKLIYNSGDLLNTIIPYNADIEGGVSVEKRGKLNTVIPKYSDIEASSEKRGKSCLRTVFKVKQLTLNQGNQLNTIIHWYADVESDTTAEKRSGALNTVISSYADVESDTTTEKRSGVLNTVISSYADVDGTTTDKRAASPVQPDKAVGSECFYFEVSFAYQLTRDSNA